MAAHSSLFNRLSCTKLVTPVPHPPPVKAILEGHTLDILEVPSVDELISKEYAHFEFSKTYPEAAGEVLAVMYVPECLCSDRRLTLQSYVGLHGYPQADLLDS